MKAENRLDLRLPTAPIFSVVCVARAIGNMRAGKCVAEDGVMGEAFAALPGELVAQLARLLNDRSPGNGGGLAVSGCEPIRLDSEN